MNILAKHSKLEVVQQNVAKLLSNLLFEKHFAQNPAKHSKMEISKTQQNTAKHRKMGSFYIV